MLRRYSVWMAGVLPSDKLEDWLTSPPGAEPRWFQDRGRAFERIIRNQFQSEGLEPRLNIRPSGEEIDGSFVLGESTYLVEAKWRKDPIPASDLYAFKGKVDGKLVGTIGVFISMSGYSSEAIDALKFGKDINLILFTGADFLLVNSGKIGFTGALRRKLRYAAEEGQPFLPLIPDGSRLEVAEPAVTDPRAPLGETRSSSPVWHVVVESEADEAGLRIIFNRLDRRSAEHVRFWAAGGQTGLESLVRELALSGCDNVAVIVGTDVPPVVLNGLREEMRNHGNWLLVLPTSVEDWLDSAVPADYANAVPETSVRAKATRRWARNADLDRLLQSSRGFADLFKRIQSDFPSGFESVSF